LGELPKQNENVTRENNLIAEGDTDEHNMIEILEEPTNQEIQEEITEILDQNDYIMDNDNEADENTEIEEEEIAGVDETYETPTNIELGKGRRRKIKNRRYYNEETINTMVELKTKKRDEEESTDLQHGCIVTIGYN